VILCAILLCLVVAVTADAQRGTTPDPESLRSLYLLLSCDLVVRGQVTSTAVSYPLGAEFTSEPTERDYNYAVEITTIRLRMQEILWGECDGDTLDFIVHSKDYPRAEEYVPGNEVIVGLVWRETELGGSYVHWNDECRFRDLEGQWVQVGGTRQAFSKDTIKSLLDHASVDSLLEGADVVLEGTAASRWLETDTLENGNRVRILRVTIDATKVLRGVSQPSYEVSAITTGDYWPIWRRPTPDIRENTAYYFLLKRIDSEYVFHGGVNGVFEVGPDKTLLRHQRPLTLSTDELRRKVGVQE
jgi:hypothetical protein